jgi:hypothetical protein
MQAADERTQLALDNMGARLDQATEALNQVSLKL